MAKATSHKTILNRFFRQSALCSQVVRTLSRLCLGRSRLYQLQFLSQKNLQQKLRLARLYRIIRVRIALISLLNPIGFNRSIVLFALTGFVLSALTLPKILSNANAFSSLTTNKKQDKTPYPVFYALGAIRTRDLSLKRGVLYLLSYKRKSYLFRLYKVLPLPNQVYQEHSLKSTNLFICVIFH